MSTGPIIKNGFARQTASVLLAVVEVPYACAVRLRNRRYDRRGPTGRVGLPVISVGNITAGGTGKTPCVIALAHLLQRLGRRPAVIARGYKSAPGLPNDEELLIRAACPGLHYAADPNRVRAADRIVRDRLADVIVLDDGFQHRALARDLDLVLIDAACPFGHDHLLPRGRLREPVDSLARAGAVIITRCDQVEAPAVVAIESRIRPYLNDRPVLRSRHKVLSVEPLAAARARLRPPPAVTTGAGVRQGRRHAVRSPEQVSNKPGLEPDAVEPGQAWPSPWKVEQQNVVLFAGVGRPQAFQATVAQLGVAATACHWFPDHHRYRQSDLDQLRRRFPQADCLLTTEKDAVKLAALDTTGMPIAVVRIAIDFDAAGLTMLESLVQEALAKHP